LKFLVNGRWERGATPTLSDTPHVIKSSYLGCIYHPQHFPQVVDATLKAARQVLETDSYDTIAFTGMSGAGLAFILSHALGIPLMCARKKDDSSHFTEFIRETDSRCEGHVSIGRYLIVDDCIASGDTMRYIIKSIKKISPAAECAAIILYATTIDCAFDRNPFYPYYSLYSGDDGSPVYRKGYQEGDENIKPIKVIGCRPETI